MTRRGISRRTFLASSVAASGLAAAGYWYWSGSGDDQSPERPANSHGIIPCSEPLALVNGKLLDTDFPDPFAGGELLGYLPFELEGPAPPFNRKSDAGHNSRLIIDVASLLMPQSRVTPHDYFFVRTEYPDMLRVPDDWTIKIGGYVKKPIDLSLSKLDSSVESKGSVLLECSGNHRSLRFGLLSVANWDGVSLEKVLDFAGPTKDGTSVLIKGFDDDSTMPDAGPPYHEHSMPTCSWVFTRDQLQKAGAFLATQLNGKPLPKDHGAPVRLVVPGWFGCSEVKWVNEIRLVDASEPATLQMLEFAYRTGQETHRDNSISTFHEIGPPLARAYKPSYIGPSLLPVRVEQWKLGDKLSYRVVGISWGDPSQDDKLVIRFRYNGRGKYNPVLFCKPKTSVSAYGIWVHRFDPPKPGHYTVDARFATMPVQSMRWERNERIGKSEIHGGFFERAITIPAV